jgi:transcriptional regulator with XRE-family HTH domain
MDFWDRVDVLIKQEKNSYAYIAKRLGKRESTVSGWHREGAKHIVPRADYAVIIAETLKTTVEYLVTGHNPAHISPKVSSKSLEIARAAEKLDDFGKQMALDMVIGLEVTHPLGRSVSINTES